MSFQKFRVHSIRDAGHVINAHQVTDTTPFQIILDLTEVDHFSLQLFWTGTIAATVKVYTSNSYNPNPTDNQNESIALNTAKWTDSGSRFTTNFTAPAGSPGDGEIHGSQVEAAFVKIVVTPTAGSGQVDGYASGKSVS